MSCASPMPIGLVDSSVQFVFAYTNSGRYAVRLSGRVEPLFMAQPTLLSLGGMAVSSSVERVVTVSALYGDQFMIRRVTALGEAVSVCSVTTNQPGRASIALRIRPVKKGMIDETVTVEVESEAQPRVDVRVLGNAK